MTSTTWYAGYLVGIWLLGYAVGQIFVSLRKFVEKCK